MIKVSQQKTSQKHTADSFRTAGEKTAVLSETSSTVSSYEENEDDEELEDTTRMREQEKPCFKPLVSSSQRKIRSSILKPSSEEIPINLKGKPFKSLPPPDMSKVQRLSSTVIVEEEEERQQQKCSNVGFASVQIREYDQTIGDNPSVSYGPPISLDWEYTQLESVTLEQYEAHRAPRRTLRQMCMNYYTRRNVLTYKFGYEEDEVKAASKQADKAKRERAVTKYFLPYAKVEDFVTSAGRKTKRGFRKSQTV